MGLAVFQSALGVIILPLLVWIAGGRRTGMTGQTMIHTVTAGLALQFVLALLLLKTPWSGALFQAVSAAVAALQKATEDGMQLVFGFLAGAPAPYAVSDPKHGFILAFRALPLILVVGALSRLLHHWGVLQRVIAAFAWLLQRTFGIGGALGTSASANIFLGMVEAPLLVRPYLAGMGRGALFATMVVGMATIAGTVMALYAAILEPVVPGAAGHMLAASLINVPAALMLARLAVPEGFSGSAADGKSQSALEARSSMDAIAQGTFDGLRLVASVAAMLVVMVAIVSLVNILLAALGQPFEVVITVQQIIGYVAAPFAWLVGIPLAEVVAAGSLIGQKIALNEFIAYLELAKTPEDVLSPRSRLLISYALCGFANLGSLGIMVGGYVAMVPERRREIADLAPLAVAVGALATLLTASVVGTLTWN